MNKKMIAILAAVLALGPSAQAAASRSGKRLIVGFKAGTPKGVRHKVLDSLKDRSLAQIRSNGNTEDEFEAMVIEPAAIQAAGMGSPAAWLRSRVKDVLARLGGGRGALSDEHVIIEEDVRVKWIESAQVNFQNVPLPDFKDVMASLSFPKAARAAYPRQPERDGLIPFGLHRLHVPLAWNKSMGEGVVLGVIDTGSCARHPALKGNVLDGYNAISNSEAHGAADDDNGHGCHVTGTMVANGRGIWGVLPKAKVVPIKVLDTNGSGTISDVVKGMIWAANHDLPVVNMSLGSGVDSEIMHRAAAYARGRGMVIVAAAGNSWGGPVGFPGAYPEVIAVAAVDSEDKLAEFSSRGPEVDFVAPGEGIISTWINNDTKNLRGTSMASPHVAALAGFAVQQGARGMQGPDGVMAALKRASSCLVRHGKDPCYGLVDAARLVQ